MRIFRRRKSKLGGNRRWYTTRRTATVHKSSPRFSPKTKEPVSLRSLTFRSLAALILIGIALLASGYFLVVSDFFLVRQVAVTGNEQIEAGQIQEWIQEAEQSRVFGLVPQNHWLFLNRTRAEKILLPQTPLLQEVKRVQRSWPNKILVEIVERAPKIIWQAEDKFFFVGGDGIVSEQIPAGYATSTDTFLKFTDLENRPVAVGQNLGIAAPIEFALTLKDPWEKSQLPKIQLVKLPSQAAKEIYFVSQAGWTVYFNLEGNPLKQLNYLRLLLEQEIPPDRQEELVYIDFRFPGVAYYCYRNEPCALSKFETQTQEGEAEDGINP